MAYDYGTHLPQRTVRLKDAMRFIMRDHGQPYSNTKYLAHTRIAGDLPVLIVLTEHRSPSLATAHKADMITRRLATFMGDTHPRTSIILSTRWERR